MKPDVARQRAEDRSAPTAEQLGGILEVSHSSLEAEQKFIGRIGELEAFRDSEGFVQRAPRSGGSVTTMMFVSRSGYRLPESADAATFPLM